MKFFILLSALLFSTAAFAQQSDDTSIMKRALDAAVLQRTHANEEATVLREKYIAAQARIKELEDKCDSKK